MGEDLAEDVRLSPVNVTTEEHEDNGLVGEEAGGQVSGAGGKKKCCGLSTCGRRTLIGIGICVGCVVLAVIIAIIVWQIFLAKETCEGTDDTDWSSITSARLQPTGSITPLNPVRSLDRKCIISKTQSCNMSSMPNGTDEYTMVFPGGETTCINTSFPFAFQVWPGDTDKLAIFFQGGGACWGKASTVYSIPHNVLPRGFCTQTVYVQRSEGVFNKSDTRNPWKDYTILHINYCSGDGHVGDAVHDYHVQDGDSCHKVAQKGYHNTRAALDWVKAQMDPSLENIVVSGSSAGSLGTQLWSKQIFTEFQSDGRSFAHGAAVADSYAAVFPPNTMTRVMRDVFGICGTGLVTGAPKEGCKEAGAKKPSHNDNELTLQSMWNDAMQTHPNVAFANVNSKADGVQVMFYDAIAISFSMLGQSQLSEHKYYQLVNKMFEHYNANPNFVSYMVDGTQHTFFFWQDKEKEGTNQDQMPVCNFYWADTSGKNGMGAENMLLSEWVDQFALNGSMPASQCRGEVLSSDEWTKKGHKDITYCDAAMQPKEVSLA